MADCPNVEIRELLPERASGALSAADLARVDGHVADCGLCGAELALIQSARLALRREPRVDTARIAAAVVARTAGTPSRPVLVTGAGRPARIAPRPRWIGWKAAAAVAIAAAGAGTMLFSSHTSSGSIGGGSSAIGGSAVSPAAATPALNVAGGLTDLSDGDLRSLLDDIGSLGLDEPSFEEPASELPEVAPSEGTES